MLEKRQKTIDSISPFQADSLDQVTQRIAKIRAEQESRMEAITTRRTDENYLDRAKVMVDAESRGEKGIEFGEPVFEDFGFTDEIEIGRDAETNRLPEIN